MARPQSLTTTAGTAITQTYSTTGTTVPAAVTAVVLTGTNIAAKTPSATLTDAVNTNAGTVATSLDQAQADLGAKINLIVLDLIEIKKVQNTIINALKLDNTLS